MKIIRYIIIIWSTALLAWGLPYLYHMVADRSVNNVFTYYSSVEEAFCTMDFGGDGKDYLRRNTRTGKVFSETEFDSILPMFYAQQLFNDGRFPDRIQNQSFSLQEINRKSFYYRYNPSHKSTPSIPIYTLFESYSGRVKLEMPGDVFRIHQTIEFINPETNQVNRGKSQGFMKALVDAGFSFPAKKAFGNPTTRKLYDEGYFVLDAKDHVFHLKMVNGKPFVKDIKVPAGIKAVYIATKEPKDKGHYGFMFDAHSRVYLITTDHYALQEIPTPKFDMDADKLTIMANPLYWTLNVISTTGKESYALYADTKELKDSLSLLRPPSNDVMLSYVFPFQLVFTSYSSDYVMPDVLFAEIWVLIVNVLLAVIYVFITRQRVGVQRFMCVAWIIITGIFGFIPSVILKK